jgi:cytochrome c oxidase cbb3-type subunit 3
MRLRRQGFPIAVCLCAVAIGLQAWPVALGGRQEQSQTNGPETPPPEDDVSLALLPPPAPSAVARGKEIFTANCAFCHGMDATGGDTGPDLVRSVLVLHDEGKGTSIAPVLHNGRPDRGMPKFDFSESQIKDIAAFLLFRNQAAANRDTYQLLNVVTGDPGEGKGYFEGHCVLCHTPTGDLAHVATKYSAPALQERFLYPARKLSDDAMLSSDPRAEKTITVTLPSGRSYSGRLLQYDDFLVALVDAAGHYRSWELDGGKNGVRAELHDPLAGHVRLLYEYSDSDVHNVLAYLETLK